VPAGAFRSIEDGWSYVDAVYFSFVTLTTIGFGDYVPGYSRDLSDELEVLYICVLILWSISGLAFWSSILQFILKVRTQE